MTNTTKNSVIAIILIVVLFVIIWAGNSFFNRDENISPLPGNGASTSTPPELGFLKLPPGFAIEVFARNLPGARVMRFDSQGNMWVSQTSEGAVSILERGADGKVVRQNQVFKNLRKPHGLAIPFDDPFALYIAEEDKIIKARLFSDEPIVKIIDLPTEGGGHFTRTIDFGPEDNKLYVSIGSSCNVCRESDSRRAKIFTMNKDGSDFKEFARGLRNSVFFTWSYVDGKMWATEMGRDLLGDNIPPDEINILAKSTKTTAGGDAAGNSKNYGWPNCYGKNIHDTDFDKNTYIRNPCMEPFETPSHVDLPAHSAPLGLAFVPEEGWPEEYWYDLLVAYHGSWNRSEPTGYKVVRVKLGPRGEFGGIEDFITGWLPSKASFGGFGPAGGVPRDIRGRPVDILIQPGGTAFISDDHAGVIYRLFRTEEI